MHNFPFLMGRRWEGNVVYFQVSYNFHLLDKGGYVFDSISMFVCLLFVSKITQKMNNLERNVMDGSMVVIEKTLNFGSVLASSF